MSDTVVLRTERMGVSTRDADNADGAAHKLAPLRLDRYRTGSGITPQFCSGTA